MQLTLDISHKEFDEIVDDTGNFDATIFLNFPSDIRGVYEFELINTVVNVYDFKNQVEQQGFFLEEDSVFVFGKTKVRIEKVKGAEFKVINSSAPEINEHYYSWPYTIDEGDTVCKCGGKMPFFHDFYASLMVVTEQNPKVTLTFDTSETVPFDFTKGISIEQASFNKKQYELKSSGKLFDFAFFQKHFGSGRVAIKSEKSDNV